MHFLIFLGPVLIALCSEHMPKTKRGNLLLFIVWLAVIAVSAAIGTLTWRPSHDSTQSAAGWICVSPSIALGPVLVGLRSGPRADSATALYLTTAVVSILSVAAVLFLLATANQINI